MKKKEIIILAAVFGIICLLVVHFSNGRHSIHITEDYGTDIAKEYKDFFDYTFGHYKIELEKESIEYVDDDRFGSRTWGITYFDKNGNYRSGRIYCTRYSADLYKYKSEKAYNDSIVRGFCREQLGEIAEEEFVDNILKAHFEDVYYSASDGLTLWDQHIKKQPYELRFSLYVETDAEMISPKNGIKLSAFDLKEIGNSEDITVYFSIIIDRSEDQQKYIEILDSIFADYKALVGEPKKYRFNVYYDIDAEHREYVDVYEIN